MTTEIQLMLFSAIIAAVGGLGKWTIKEMKDCKEDRTVLHGKLTQAVEDCSNDRMVLHERITELRIDLSRVNAHLESTDTQQVKNTKAIEDSG